MAGKILPFTGGTTEDINPDTVLENNMGEYECVVIVGYSKMGAERMVSSTGDSALMVWLLERAKKTILEHADLDDEEWEH